MERIESSSNAKIKWAAALHQRKERDSRGEFVAEGVRLAETALDSGWPVLFCLVTETALANSRAQKIAASLEEKNCPVYIVSESAYKKAAATESPQGILLVMKSVRFSLSDFPAEGNPFFVVLDRIQDPGNVGTILRTADAAGCAGVIATEGTVDIFSDKVVRSSMGSIFHLPIATNVSGSELSAYFKAQKISCMATVLDETAQSHFAADYRKKAAVVFGNEGNGVSPEVLALSEHIFIPMAGRTESLNVATSAAIILYEAFRQRHFMDSSQHR